MLEADVARVAGTDRAIPITTLARAAYHQTHRFKGEVGPGISETATYDPPGTFSNACHVAMVEVDIETGRVTIEKFVVAEDAGRLINPMIVEGQITGGLTEGYATAAMQLITFDEVGNAIGTNFMDYLIPTAWETPTFELGETVTPSPHHPIGAKGVGESATVGSPAAYVNAVIDALQPLGVKNIDMPLTSAKVWEAIQAAKSASMS